MINPFTSILEHPDLWAVAKLNLFCPVSYRVCHDEIEMWAADKLKETINKPIKELQ